MSIISVVSVVAYGIYKLYNKFSQNTAKEKKSNGAANALEITADRIYNKSIEWLPFVESIDQEFKKEENVIKALIIINSLLYEKHEITSAGFFITEKNLSQALQRIDASKLIINDNLQFFAIATDNGKVFYMKNEFYEVESGDTACVFTTIEDTLSPVVGVGFIGHNKIFAISYANGDIALFTIENETSLKKVIQQPASLNSIDAIFSTVYPIFLTINDQYEEQLWNVQEECKYVCLSTTSFKHLIKPDEKVYLTSGLLADLSEDIITSNIVLNNLVDKTIEIYTSNKDIYTCNYSIPYTGTITCSIMNLESLVFAFYQKDGEDEGLHVYNVITKKHVAHFTPYDKQKQHPIKLFIKGDKIFCLYVDGIMDMWYCQVDRRKAAEQCIKKIIAPLAIKHKKEFLKQFGLYLQERTEQNYELLVKLGSIGLEKKTVQAELLFLQFLPPLENMDL